LLFSNPIKSSAAAQTTPRNKEKNKRKKWAVSGRFSLIFLNKRKKKYFSHETLANEEWNG